MKRMVLILFSVLVSGLTLANCTVEPAVSVPETVTTGVSGVTLDNSSLLLMEGEQELLIAVITPSNASEQGLSWSSSAPGVAAVSSNGQVTGIAGGDATITVTTVDGSYTADCLVHVLAQNSGVLDVTYDSDGVSASTRPMGGYSDVGNNIYVDTNGNVYVTGYGKNSSNNKDMIVWKYKSDGSLDTAFGGGDGIFTHDVDVENTSAVNEDDEGKAIYVDPQGKIYVTGSTIKSTDSDANTGTKDYDMVLWKLNADGTLDTGFNGQGYLVFDSGDTSQDFMDEGKDIHIDDDGKVLVAGYANQAMTVWKFQTDGQPDTNFATNGIVSYKYSSYDQAWGMYVHTDGSIFLAGRHYDGAYKLAVWKYTAAGEPDTGFNGTGMVTYDFSSTYFSGNNLCVDTSNNVYVAGYSRGTVFESDTGTFDSSYSTCNYMHVMRYTSGGVLDTSFGSGGIARFTKTAGQSAYTTVVYDIRLDENYGKLYVSGAVVNSATSYHDMALWRINMDGTADTHFGTNGIVTVGDPGYHTYGYAMYKDPENTIFVTGQGYDGNFPMMVWKYR